MSEEPEATGSDAATVPPGIDATVPHSARIWNYWLGGKDNYPVDRAAGDAYRAVFPDIEHLARASRAFLVRVVEHLAGEVGIRQFLDIGTGLPTEDNTHEVAQRVAPESRIVYVDNDPLVLTHARAMLTSSPQGDTRYIHADLYEPESILKAAGDILDFSQPVALILMGILGHVSDLDEARSIVKRFMDGVPSGSYLAIYDGTDVVKGDEVRDAQQGYDDTGAIPYTLRKPEEIAGFFEGLELLEPGVVSVPRWRPRPGDTTDEIDQFGGVGRKP